MARGIAEGDVQFTDHTTQVLTVAGMKGVTHPLAHGSFALWSSALFRLRIDLVICHVEGETSYMDYFAPLVVTPRGCSHASGQTALLPRRQGQGISLCAQDY